MRTHRWISAFTLVAALAACGGGGEEGEGRQGGEADVGSSDAISPTTGQETGPGPGEGSQAVGSPSAQEQATSVNDTTPHRPGAPASP